jgi:hypothetical protein
MMLLMINPASHYHASPKNGGVAHLPPDCTTRSEALEPTTVAAGEGCLLFTTLLVGIGQLWANSSMQLGGLEEHNVEAHRDSHSAGH